MLEAKHAMQGFALEQKITDWLRQLESNMKIDLFDHFLA